MPPLDPGRFTLSVNGEWTSTPASICQTVLSAFVLARHEPWRWPLIIVARYPGDIVPPTAAPLDTIREQFERLLPPGVALHLLPFWPSSGDGGFAIDAWDSVDPRYGTWEHVQALAKSRPVIVDAVVNHVGLGHEIIREFLAEPWSNRNFIFAYPELTDGAPTSPRGGTVLKPIETAEGTWYVWCSFTSSAVDINLEFVDVRDRINTLFRGLRHQGIWGVRLDAVAYFKKALGQPLRHIVGVHELASSVADDAKKFDLEVFAQLDADSLGRRYFQEDRHADIGLFDFAFPAMLLLSFHTKDTTHLSEHLATIDRSGRRIVRSPRTHDGMLLRSEGLASHLPEILEMAEQRGLDVRYENDRPYELNESLIAAIRRVIPDISGEARCRFLRMLIVLSCFTSDDAYFYFPSIIGFEPESDYSPDQFLEPRDLNRAAIPDSFIASFEKQDQGQLRATMMLMLQVQQESTTRRYASQGGCLTVFRGAWTGIFNLGGDGTKMLTQSGKVALQSGVDEGGIALAGGYRVIVEAKEGEHASPGD